MKLRDQKVGLFGERDNCDAALKYAQSMFDADQLMVVTTAVMVYHNTLIEALAKATEEKK